MKIKLVYLTGIVLVAGAMAFAQSSQSGTTTQSSSDTTTHQNNSHTDANGDLPAAKEDESQSGKSSTADSSSERPGAMGTPETPNTGASPKGETPATGMQTGQRGSSEDNDSRPATKSTPDDTTDHSIPEK
jgi:hypothetical protein